MRRAITLSAFGVGTTSPNPPVGCVVLDVHGRVVGEGYHQRKGEPHAEALALAMAGGRAAGGTAVVTLEPCNHRGRTPPCRQALLDAGVKRVVIAVIDPTSRGEGGAARLAAAGVSVELGVLADEAMLVSGPWLAALGTGRPHVIWAYEAGPDGPSPVADDVVAATGLRDRVDAVLGEDGSVEEATPGAHGPDVFGVALPPVEDAAGVLSSLYAGGIRLLLVNGPSQGGRFASAGEVDELRVFVSRPLTAHLVRTDSMLLPAGFRLSRVERQHDLVVLVASPSEPDR